MFLLCQLIRFIDNQGLHLLASLALEEGECLGRKWGGGRVGEEIGVVERKVIVIVDDNCMAPGNLKMDIPKSPMREEGDT